MMMFLERRERRDRDVEAIRLSLLSSGRARPFDVFPETFGQFNPSTGDYEIVDDGSQESERAISKAKRTGDVAYDYSDVEWASPSDSPEELQDLLQLQQALLGAQAISVTDED